jgi:hypothetical protein
VPGTPGCAACNDGIDNDVDGFPDAPADSGCVTKQDASEVLGDLSYDGVLDERDRPRMTAAFGRRFGEVGYVIGADLDPPGAPDGVVGLVDWQRWLAAEQAARAAADARRRCGLLGVEPLLLLAALGAARRRRARGRRRALGALGLALAAALLAAPRAEAGVTLRFEPAGELVLAVGESVDLRVLGDLSQPIVGFGFDLAFDGARLRRESGAAGPAGIPGAAGDGDGLAGLATLPGVSGNGVLLATLRFRGLAPGLGSLALGITPGDPTEGFALSEIGAFDSVSFPAALPVRVVPEPASALLLAAGLLACARRRGPRAPQRAAGRSRARGRGGR